MSVDAIMQAVEALSEQERDALFDRLDEQYGNDVDIPLAVTPETLKLLEERDKAYEANPDDVHTWEEVVAFVQRKR